MKYLLSVATLFLLLTACTKNRQITITGRLMQSCDVPAANKEALIHIDGGGITAKPIVELPFTTDENGYFEVHHDEAFSKFSVRTSSAHSVLEASIGEDIKALGKVYVFPPSIKYFLNLDVKNSYSEFDTLYFRDLGYPQNGAISWSKKIPGPFTNGVLDTVYAININGLPVNFGSSSASTMMLGYNINFNAVYQNSMQVEFPHCQDEYQTVTLVIE
jgi:hypothetical protein